MGVPFSQASGPKLLLPRVRGGPLPTSTRGSTLFASSRPQTPEFCTPRVAGPCPPARVGVPFSQAPGPKLPNCVLPRVAGPCPPARVGVLFSQAPGPKLPNSVLPRVAGPCPPARVGVPFSQAPGPKLPNCVLPRVAGSSPAWEYLFASFRPQTPELCTPPRGSAAIPPRLQNVLFSTLLGLGDWNHQEPRTEPQEPSEKPNRMNLNRLFKTATEPNRTVTFMSRPMVSQLPLPEKTLGLGLLGLWTEARFAALPFPRLTNDCLSDI